MKKLIVIDPGHGGEDNGAKYGGRAEDEFNLSISSFLQYELLLRDFDAFLTREKDEDVSLEKRVQIAKAYRADAFISIHCDAWHSKTTEGMTVHIPPVPSLSDFDLSEEVGRKLKIFFPMHRSRDTRKSNFYVLRETYKIPSILIECEFMSNPEQLKFLTKIENQKRMARAICLAIMRVFE